MSWYVGNDQVSHCAQQHLMVFCWIAPPWYFSVTLIFMFVKQIVLSELLLMIILWQMTWVIAMQWKVLSLTFKDEVRILYSGIFLLLLSAQPWPVHSQKVEIVAGQRLVLLLNQCMHDRGSSRKGSHFSHVDCHLTMFWRSNGTSGLRVSVKSPMVTENWGYFSPQGYLSSSCPTLFPACDCEIRLFTFPVSFEPIQENWY